MTLLTTSTKLIKAVDAPIRNVPFDILKRIDADLKGGKVKAGDKVTFASYADTVQADKLPLEVRAMIRDASITIPASGKLADAELEVGGKKTGVKASEVQEYMYGNAYLDKPPRIAEFYAKMGVSKSILDGNPVVKETLKQVDANFKELKGYTDGFKDRLAKRYGEEYRKTYSEDPQGFQKYCEDYPNEFGKYLEELEKEPSTRARLFANEQAKKLWETIKKNPGKSLLVALAAILAPVVYTLVEEWRQQQNGCRLYDNEGGLLDKVELLTCSDSAVDAVKGKSATDTGVPLRATCATQNFPGTTPIACPVDQFNPCLGDAKNRGEADSYPFVPDVCDTYLYRKTLGPNDTQPGLTRINACGNVSEDGFCSAEYCDAARFGSVLTDIVPGASLQCVNYKWSEAFARRALSFASDVVCAALPFCSPPGGGGTDFSWLKWAILIGIVLVIAVFVYRKFTARRNASDTIEAQLALLRKQVG